jgi:hypothetical protein
MELEIIMLNKVTQIKKSKYCVFLIDFFFKGKKIEGGLFGK